MASDEARVAMLRLATEEDARFELDTCELERGGTSYTFDTVMAYQKAHPECELYWILGGDQFELLPQWHRIDELAELLTFIVLQRPGYSTTLPAVQGLQYLEVEAPLMPHSSTDIRRAIQAGCLAKDLVPASVEAFIYSHALYTR